MLEINLLALPLVLALLSCCCGGESQVSPSIEALGRGFAEPPDSARPGVYWYFMDGNISREGMTADLESMKKAGIGNLVFLEVNVGIPLGRVEFLSEEWQELFKHAIREAERLGIAITLGVGPGWSGSGGPWVSAKQSMKHLVASSVRIKGPHQGVINLAKPDPKTPYFGEQVLTPELRKQSEAYYEDVAVLAFPTPLEEHRIQDIDEKALYYRAPYTSRRSTRPWFPAVAAYDTLPADSVISRNEIVDVTRHLQPDGQLDWNVPDGDWTIMRFGSRNNGAVTRPAPLSGLGFESDKFDAAAFGAHLDNFVGKLLAKVGSPSPPRQGGLRTLHMDSWEMGAQNWTANFRQEFQKRRGYDPLPFFPVYAGLVVESLETSERFLWDLRQTSQDLILAKHVRYLKSYGKQRGLALSIEPYDMNPTADLELGAAADVPMCEFWSVGYGFNSTFSCLEAASLAHVGGRQVVAAEAFTAARDAWKQYPGSMKNQGDWAFATGINRLVYHTFQHQPLADNLRPGMTMGQYGVHWDRNQTWWPMADAYHRYISRCQYLLQQGRAVADVLYLTPEGSPHVFRPPPSAVTGAPALPDRRGFNFDGCSPSQLATATVVDQRIVFPSGASYRLLVLPSAETSTPALLEKIGSLVADGAIITGNPPVKSPSLTDYPACDQQVAALAKSIWGASQPPETVSVRSFGKGKIFWGGALSDSPAPELFPSYDATAAVLHQLGAQEDFVSDSPIRYSHRALETSDIYFVSNPADTIVNAFCSFRVNQGTPELWEPITGEIRPLPVFTKAEHTISIPLHFEPHESHFVVFNREREPENRDSADAKNFPPRELVTQVAGPWEVAFDPRWGGPEKARFEQLEDWSANADERIKYYSGIATYRNAVELPATATAHQSELYLHLGKVHNLAGVRVNGKPVGVVWTPPFELKITAAVRQGSNEIEIEVANLWPNRLIGDERFADDGIKELRWPEWLLKNQPRQSERVTFATFNFFGKNSELLKSGLLGPVQIFTSTRR